MPAKKLCQPAHARWAGENDVLAHAKLVLSLREFIGRENCMVGFLRNLIIAQLRGVLGLPVAAILSIVDDFATNFSVLDHVMDDVSAHRTLLDAPDPVVRERRLQQLKEFELGAFAVFVGRFLLQAALHVLQLLLKIHPRFEILCPLGVHGRDLVFFQRLPLLVHLVDRSVFGFFQLHFCLRNLRLGVSDRFVLVSDLIAHEPFGDLDRRLTDTEGFGRRIFFQFRDFNLFGLTKLIELKRVLPFKLRRDRVLLLALARRDLAADLLEFLGRNFLFAPRARLTVDVQMR